MKRNGKVNVIQMKLNIIISDIQKIAVEIDNIKKRVSDLELAQISVNIKDKEQPVIPNKDLEAKQ